MERDDWDWEALAAAMRHRRNELHHTNRAGLARAKGLTDTQYRLLMDLENAKRTNFEQGTLTLVEVVYEWEPGSVQRVLRGQSPTPVPRQREMYAAHPPLDDDTDSRTHPESVLERLIAEGFAQAKADTEAMERRLSERISKVEKRLNESS